MADRPLVAPRWATDPGARVEPTSGRKDTGFLAGGEPAAGEHNFLMGNQADWIEYLDEVAQTFRRSTQGPFTTPVVTGTTLTNVGSAQFGADGRPDLIAGDDNEMFFSVDGAVNWKAFAGAALSQIKESSLFTDSFYSGAGGRRLIVAAGTQGVAYRGNPRTGSWTTKALPAGNAQDVLHYDDDIGRGMVRSSAASNRLYFFDDITDVSPFTLPTTPPAAGGDHITGFARSSVSGVWVCSIQDAVTGNFLFRSTNGGVDWSAVATAPAAGSLATANYGLVYMENQFGSGNFFQFLFDAGTGLKLWRGTDDGDTFTDVSLYTDTLPNDWRSNNNTNIEGVKRIGPGVALARGRFVSGVNVDLQSTLLTVDSGISWKPVTVREMDAGGDSIRAAALHDGQIYMVGTANANEALWRTLTF